MTANAEKNRNWLTATGDALLHGVIQPRIWRKILPGVMHFFLFWGVLIQAVGTAINLVQMKLFTPFELTNFPRGGAYLTYEFFMDLAGVFILAGVAIALFRRLVLKPKFMETRRRDFFGLVIFTLISVAGFSTESMRIIASDPPWARTSFVGNMLAGWFRAAGLTPETAFTLQQILVLTHIGLALFAIAMVPSTKLRHIFYSPLNVLLKPRRKLGELEKIDDLETAESLGAGHTTEFNTGALLSFDACTQCGRCEGVCPATLSGMAYSPRTLLDTLRGDMASSLLDPGDNGSTEVSERLLEEEYLWACTTCGACLTRCPVFIRPPERVVDLRRYLVLMTGAMPKTVGETMRNMERQGNPWGMPPQTRLDWAEGLDVPELAPGDQVEILFYPGCAAAFDERNKKVTRAFVRLMRQADVDFGVLGLDEACCGETARRMGHEYIFQVFAEQNIGIFESVDFNRIVTTCPHCFNTFKNEYPQMGGEFEVIHATQLMGELAEQGKLAANGSGAKLGRVSYHDSCYLGRYNHIYETPRQLLDGAQTDRVEMKRKGENGFCCGGGGGGMWVETAPDERINHTRLQDALDVGADTIATACPYCLTMFDDAARSKGLGGEIRVLDIAEILAGDE